MEIIKNIATQYGVFVMLLVLLLLILGFFLLFRSFSLLQLARRNMDNIMRGLREKSEKKIVDAEKERRAFGSTGRGDRSGAGIMLLSAIDDKLVYSEFSIKFRWLNASSYLILSILVATFAFLVGYLAGGILIALIVMVVAVLAPYCYIDHVANENYLKTEQHLEFFIESVSSNAVASSDLLTILEKIAPRMANPIRDAIYRAIATARVSGKSDDGIWQLIREIEYPLFKEFLRNLEICGKQDADYRSVAQDFSKQVRQRLKAIERQRAIYQNARYEVILTMVVGVFLSFQTASLCERSLFEVIADMRTTVLGLVCLVGEVLIYTASMLYVLVGKRR